jgi:hypothetical protein
MMAASVSAMARGGFFCTMADLAMIGVQVRHRGRVLAACKGGIHWREDCYVRI